MVVRKTLTSSLAQLLRCSFARSDRYPLTCRIRSSLTNRYRCLVDDHSLVWFRMGAWQLFRQLLFECWIEDVCPEVLSRVTHPFRERVRASCCLMWFLTLSFAWFFLVIRLRILLGSCMPDVLSRWRIHCCSCRWFPSFLFGRDDCTVSSMWKSDSRSLSWFGTSLSFSCFR